jgi:RES domain-containing protein
MVAKEHENEILNVQGSSQVGGRYNPPGEFGVLYLSENEKVSVAERLRKGESPYPMTLAEIEVNLSEVLDLTDDTHVKRLGINKGDLLRVTGNVAYDYGITREIASRARAKGIEGLLVPSVTSKGKNLVIFIDNLKSKSGSFVKVLKLKTVRL